VLARFTRLLLVVALIAGWQSALVHPIAHVDAAGQPVHLGDGSERSNVSCELLDALTACVSHVAAAVPVFSASDPSAHYPAGAPRAAEAPPFLSQGPPAAV
jgi:hypothetical protein